jgi:hypothetical protein
MLHVQPFRHQVGIWNAYLASDYTCLASRSLRDAPRICVVFNNAYALAQLANDIDRQYVCM